MIGEEGTAAYFKVLRRLSPRRGKGNQYDSQCSVEVRTMRLLETFPLYHHGYDATVMIELNWHRTESTAGFVFAYTTYIMNLRVKKKKR
jgi:hypothetical protein